MKSVINAAARRNMEAAAQKIGPQALEAAAQAMRFRTESDVRQGLAEPNAGSESSASSVKALPSLGAYEEHLEAAPSLMSASMPASGLSGHQKIAQFTQLTQVAQHSAKRIGDLLYVSGLVAAIAPAIPVTASPSAPLIATRYEQLPEQARAQLRSIGFDTGDINMDALEAPIVVQSWVVLERIRAIAQQHGAQPAAVFKLVVYLRDLRQYPAYQRVCQLLYPQGVVSTVVEVSRLLPCDDVLIQVEATASLVALSA